MSDSLGFFTLQKRSNVPPANQPISDDSGWSNISTTIPSTDRFANDSTTPDVWYRLKQTTANGVVVPYPVRPLTSTNQAIGTWVWQNYFYDHVSGGGAASCLCVTIDSHDNVIVGGSFVGASPSNATTFPDGSNVLSPGSPGAFIIKFNSSGVFQWKKTFGGTAANGVACLATIPVNGQEDDVLMGGSFAYIQSASPNTIIIDANTSFTTAGNTFDNMVFVKLRGSDGLSYWGHTYDGLGQDKLNSRIAVAANGDFFISGAADAGQALTIGGITTAASGVQCGVFARLNAANPQNAVWVRRLTAGSFIQGTILGGSSLDKDENFVIAGTVSNGSYDFGSGLTAFGPGVFIAKYKGTDGTPAAGFSNPVFISDPSTGLTCDSMNTDPVTGEIWIGGFVKNGPVDFGNGHLTPSTQNGNGYFYIAKFSSAGICLGLTVYGSGIQSSDHTIITTKSLLILGGKVYACGICAGTINFLDGQGSTFGQNSGWFMVLNTADLSFGGFRRRVASSNEPPYNSGNMIPLACFARGNKMVFAGSVFNLTTLDAAAPQITTGFVNTKAAMTVVFFK